MWATFWGAKPLYPLCSLQRLQGSVLPASSSVWGLQAALGWWLPPSCFCLYLPMASPLCLCLILCLLGGRCPWMEGPPHPGGAPLRPFPWPLLCVFSVISPLVIGFREHLPPGGPGPWHTAPKKINSNFLIPLSRTSLVFLRNPSTSVSANEVGLVARGTNEVRKGLAFLAPPPTSRAA